MATLIGSQQDQSSKKSLRERLEMKVGPHQRCLFAVAWLAMLVSASAANSLDKNGSFIIWGAGATTCERWTAARARGVPLAAQSWIQGFVSSHNHYAEGPNDLGKGMSPDDLRSWVDNYCSGHPDHLLAAAAEALVIELILRRPPNGSADQSRPVQ
jgi:hypothetical protein